MQRVEHIQNRSSQPVPPHSGSVFRAMVDWVVENDRWFRSTQSMMDVRGDRF